MSICNFSDANRDGKCNFSAPEIGKKCNFSGYHLTSVDLPEPFGPATIMSSDGSSTNRRSHRRLRADGTRADAHRSWRREPPPQALSDPCSRARKDRRSARDETELRVSKMRNAQRRLPFGRGRHALRRRGKRRRNPTQESSSSNIHFTFPSQA